MLKAFVRSDRGFALVLTLLFLPVFVGIGLLVIDIGRGNNAQGDHQTAADALALAGARELDGLDGSRARAMQAMEEISNNVSFLGLNGSDINIDLSYTAGTNGSYTVIFLSEIPPSDDTPIDQGWVDDYVATTDADANYVYVFSRDRDLSTFFFNPLTRAKENVPVGATAVATLKTATCDLAPMYMCNIFPTFEELETNYETGQLHGRLQRLRSNPSQTTEPGNVGFLRTGDPNAEYDFIDNDIRKPKGGTKNLMAALAGGNYFRCVVPGETVYTQPGASPKALEALNTRFGAYIKGGGQVSDFAENGIYPPARNVRKGWEPDNNSDCGVEPKFTGSAAAIGSKKTAAYAQNPVFSENSEPVTVGASSVLWNLNDPVTITTDGITVTYAPYWETVHGSDMGATQMSDIASFGTFPSRYDVYRYELSDTDMLEEASPGGEVATPGACYTGTPKTNPLVDRRTMLMAVIDCDSQNVNGMSPVEVEGYAKVFIANPAGLDSGNVGTINVEIYDVLRTSDEGNDRFLRNEAMLVR